MNKQICFFKKFVFLNNRFKAIALKRLFILILLLNFEFYSQNNSYYIGFLYEYTDNKPIENAHISVFSQNKITVFISDEEGKFKIPLQLLTKDYSIEITTTKHEGLVISNILQHTFKLKERINHLDEVIIESSDLKKINFDLTWLNRLNTFEKSTIWSSLLAVYIPYEKQNATKSIKILKYRVTDLKWTTGLKYLPFEATLFTINEKTKLPDAPIIPYIPIKRLKDQKWASIDISELRVSIPKEGLFIVMKILSKEFYNEQYIATIKGVFEASPAIRFYKFDPYYIRKSYQYFPFSEVQPSNSQFQGWQLFRGHFLIDYEY